MIAIGCDHGGYALKLHIIDYLEKKGFEYKDFGCYDTASVGVSIVANKVPGVRAALCSDCFSAQATREHNDSNVLTFGERVIGPGLAVKIVDIWLNTPFSGDPRHMRRIEKITQAEKKYSK